MALAQTGLGLKNAGIGIAILAATAGVVWVGFQVVKTGKKVAEIIPDALKQINPLNQENIFASAADNVTQAVTGDRDTSLGSSIFDGVQSIKKFFSGDDTPTETVRDARFRPKHSFLTNKVPEPVDFT